MSPRANLPATVTSLVGRAQEIANVREHLQKADTRLVTLMGPPGIGKTRLSIEAARESLPDFPDGVFFVALAPLEDPDLILPTAFQTLGYVEREDQSVERLIKDIGDKRILLVLDNAEHLLDDTASLASRLLSACSRLKILVTSREALRVPGEWFFPVPPLDLPKVQLLLDLETSSQYPALTLFAERARAVRPDFALTDANIQAVASICAQLDGLPLAIELIAARIRLMSPRSLLERLNDQFVLSADGMRAVPARQKTLQNAIQWSCNLLSSDEQKIFACLSVFSGGFTLAMVEEIFVRAFAEKPISDLVASLFDKSLLQRASDRRGEIRFQMLVTIQQFASNRLRKMGIEVEARNGHLAYFLALAEEGDAEMRGPSQAEWIERLESEHDNFRAALEWCVSSQKTESALRLLCALGWPWEIQSHFNEARNWFDKIRPLTDIAEYPAIYARVLNHIGRHSWVQGKFRDARDLLEESRAIALQLKTEGELILAENLNWMGLLTHFAEQDDNKAKVLFQQSLEIFEKWDDVRGMALSKFHLGIAEEGLHHEETAHAIFEQSLAMFRELGDLFFIARASEFLMQFHQRRGDQEKARSFLDQHLEIDRKLQHWGGMADALDVLSDLLYQQGKQDEAERCRQESISIRREHGLSASD